MPNTDLYLALREFYLSHQITKTKNILDLWANNRESITKLNFPKCICHYFNIDGGWPQPVKNMAKKSTCFTVRKALENTFNPAELNGCASNPNCGECYYFCINNYLKKGGRIRLNERKF